MELCMDDIYQRRREKAKDLMEAKKNAIYRGHPFLENLDQQIYQSHLAIARSVLMKQEEEEYSLRRQLQDLQQEREVFLQKNGLSQDDFQIHYRCDQCQDTGTMVTAMGVHPCSCRKEIITAYLAERSNLGSLLEKQNFDSFREDLFDDINENPPGALEKGTQRENLLFIKEKAMEFVNYFQDSNTKSLLFYGGAGLGKSFMSLAIAKAIMDKGSSVVYYTAWEIIRMAEEITFDRVKTDKEISRAALRAMEEADLLIIDDLGSEMVNSFVRSTFFNLINSRCLHGKKIILSTNLSPQELKDTYDERLFSRITMYFDLYKFIGEDIRWKLNGSQ